MIRLHLSPEPVWLDLLPGVRLRLAPASSTVIAAARADPAVAALGEDAPHDALAVALAKAVARRVILDWEGVLDHRDAPAPATPEAIDALIDLFPAFAAFQSAVLAPQLERAEAVAQEKNASAPSPTGATAGATATARPARSRARTARRA